METKERKRLFVGGLFNGVKEEDLIQRFSPFGEVVSVEIKVKNYEDTTNTFAFLNLNIDKQNLVKCMNAFRNARWNGREIKVEVAQESFLNRLKTERESLLKRAQQSNSVERPNDNISEKIKTNLQKPRQKIEANLQKPQRYTFDNSILGDLEKFSEVWKDNENNEPRMASKSESAMLSKRQISESKRLQSFERKIEIAAEKQKWIEDSLRNADSSGKLNKKVKFESDDEDAPETLQVNNETQHLPLETNENIHNRLFESDSEEENVEDVKEVFQIRPQFEGKEGQKLLDLKRKYGNDDRFKIDERFVDDEENDDLVENVEEDVSLIKEKESNLEVLQSVLGYHLPMRDTERHTNRKRERLLQLRYDPTNADTNLEIHPAINNADKKEDSHNKKLKSSKDCPENSAPEVSKERFYHISNSLKDALLNNEKTNDNSTFTFSFLTPEEKVKGNSEDKNEFKTPIRTAWDTNPFIYDTSDDDDGSGPDAEEECETSAVTNDPSHNGRVKSNDKSDNSQPTQVSEKRESFFFFPGDSRLTDGVEFFRRHDSVGTITEKWSNNKQHIKDVFRTFHKTMSRNTRTKRNMKNGRKFIRGKKTRAM